MAWFIQMANCPFPALVLAVSGSLAMFAGEVPRALPVDPSEITPEQAIELEDDLPVANEAEPLPPGEVSLPEPKKNPRTDTPELVGLPTGDDAVRLQIFLDEARFGPGVIDGMPGRFTIQGMNAWNEVHGHPANEVGPALAAAREKVTNPFAVAVVPESASKWVNPKLSYKKSEQANAKAMSYRSYVEFMSERYHTDIDFLVQINGRSLWDLKPRDPVIVPNVEPFLIERIRGGRHETEEALANRHVIINTETNQLRIFEATPTALVVQDPDEPVQVRANRALVASFPITPGKPQFIKYGLWELKNAVELPIWRYDQSLLDTGRRSNNALNIPPGPNSPVGVIWLGLSVSGIGMHGTSNPETIGRARSAGCIRLANWDAMRLPDYIRPGASVEIR